jgi:hypothetical protein
MPLPEALFEGGNARFSLLMFDPESSQFLRRMLLAG